MESIRQGGKALWVFDVIKQDQKSWPEEEAAKYPGVAGHGCLEATTSKQTPFITGRATPLRITGERIGKAIISTPTRSLALEPKTGKLKWYRQEIEHDLWDYNSAYEMLLIKRVARIYRSSKQKRLRVRHGQARRQA